MSLSIFILIKASNILEDIRDLVESIAPWYSMAAWGILRHDKLGVLPVGSGHNVQKYGGIRETTAQMVSQAQGIQSGLPQLGMLSISVVGLAVINLGRLGKLTARGAFWEEASTTFEKDCPEFLLLQISRPQAQSEHMATCIELSEDYWTSPVVHISTVQRKYNVSHKCRPHMECKIY